MATYVIGNEQVYVAQYDITQFVRELSLSLSFDVTDSTTLASTYKVANVGLLDGTIDISGLMDTDAGGSEPTLQPLVGSIANLSVVTQDADGAVAYFGRGSLHEYEIFGAVGDVAPLSLSASATPFLRGTLFARKLARTANGNSAAYNLGSASAPVRVWAGVHVFAASGTTPSLTVDIESDDSSGMLSPITRITLGPFSAAGSGWDSVTNVTDSWWRAKWTISGTGPSFTFAVICGRY